MLVVFDCDGVVIDSGRLIHGCYVDVIARLRTKTAGNPDRTKFDALCQLVVPDDILACEGVNWFTPQVGVGLAQTIKRMKNERYLERLRHVKFTPALDAAQQLQRQGHRCWLLTGAPPGTRAVLQRHAPSWPFALALDGIRTPAKMQLLAELRKPGVYVDDQLRFRHDLPPGWQFVWYDRQDTAALVAEVLGRRNGEPNAGAANGARRGTGGVDDHRRSQGAGRQPARRIAPATRAVPPT